MCPLLLLPESALSYPLHRPSTWIILSVFCWGLDDLGEIFCQAHFFWAGLLLILPILMPGGQLCCGLLH